MNYTYERIEIKSFNQKNTAVGHVYYPKDIEPIGTFQILHGMAEYLRRYEEFASYLCGKGYIVCGLDHVGHGESINTIDELGYFNAKDGAEVMVRDARSLFEKMSGKHKDLPYFMFGHSMGSMALRKYLMTYGEKDLAGAIICGTGGPNPMVTPGLAAAKTIQTFRGDKHRSNFVNNLAFGAYNDRYENKKTEYDWLSRDEEQVNKYINDDKCGFIFTISGLITVLGMLKEINKKEGFSKYPKNLPIFIISGSMDPVGDFGTGVRVVYESLKNEGLKDLQIKLYDDARHELLNEINKEEVYEDIYSWLENVRNK